MISWLASYPKSGNTWIRALVAAYLRDGEVDIGNMLGSESDANPKWFQAKSPVALDTLTDRDKMYFRSAGLFDLSMKVRPPTLVKTHSMFCNFHGMPMFPSGCVTRAFYLVRDPRDVVISLADHLGISIDEAIKVMNSTNFTLGGGNKMPMPVGSWSHHYKTWNAAMPEEQPLILIKYEELLERPHGVFAFLLGRWGVKVDVARVGRAVRRAEFNTLRKAEETATNFNEKSEHTDRFFRQGTAGGWKGILSSKQVASIEENHEEVMIELGYLH